MTEHEPVPAGALVIAPSRNVADAQRNTFGFVDYNPDDDDPAIAVAIGIHSTGERIGRILRLGDHLTDGGLDLIVHECRTGDDPRLVLVPAAATTTQ